MSIINEYYYKPKTFTLHKLNNENNLYIGCEIEVAMGGESEDNAKIVSEMMNTNDTYVYIKHDGSLIDGMEIVTMPCTYEFYQSLNYKNTFDKLVKLGYKAHDTSCCGLHMHVNRDFFGNSKLEQDLNISKLLYLFEKFWTEITYVARRGSTRYAQRFYMEQNDTIMDIYAKSKNSDRYSIINLKNENTVEIRVYKGTLNYDTFINTIEFTKKICEYAKTIDIYNVGLVLWSDIEKDFSQQLKDYIEDRKKKTDEIKDSDNNNDLLNSAFRGVSLNSIYGGMTLRGTRGTRADEILDYGQLCATYSNMLNSAQTNLDMSHLNNSDTQIIHQESSEEERLKRKIIEWRQRLRRCRNQLETMTINRQIASYENDLRILRMRNNSNTNVDSESCREETANTYILPITHNHSIVRNPNIEF